MTTAQPITTAEELALAENLGPCELIRGELIMMSPGGAQHGRLAARVAAALEQHVRANALGVVFGAETGFRIDRNPDTVRAPDVAFISAARYPEADPLGFFEGPPDLAVEILSPGDRAGAVLAKVQDWLTAGCHEVWVLDPQTRTLYLHRAHTGTTLLTTVDTLRSDALPGFSIVLAELFAR